MIKRDIIVESLGGYYYKISKDSLKYAVKQWIYYDTARTIIPRDVETLKLQKRLNKIYKHTGKYMSWEQFRVTNFK